MTTSSTRPLGQKMITLVEYVTALRRHEFCRGDGCYPVLGSNGDEFVLEIAEGSFSDRVIKRSIYVSLECSEPAIVSVQRLGEFEDAVRLPDAAHLIALLGMLERTFRREVKVLHPLDQRGDYMPGWSQALCAIAAETPF